MKQTKAPKKATLKVPRIFDESYVLSPEESERIDKMITDKCAELAAIRKWYKELDEQLEIEIHLNSHRGSASLCCQS